MGTQSRPGRQQAMRDLVSNAPDPVQEFLYPSSGVDNLFVNRNNPSTQALSRLTQYSANSKEFHLEMLTQPLQSIATEWTDNKKPRSHKKRKTTEWPLEPAPVIAFRISNGGPEATDSAILTSCPNVFCVATLTDEHGKPTSSEFMRGRHSSSLFKLEKEKTQTLSPVKCSAMGVFLFDQIHVRFPGTYCLLFTLFEMQMHDQGMHAVVHNVIRSNPFTVLPQPKRLPKPEAPAAILVALAAQGAKIKIRKPNEERQKKSNDWSVNPTSQELVTQPQMGQSVASMLGHGQMMQQTNHLMSQANYTSGLGSLPLPYNTPATMSMPMTNVPYQVPMQAQMTYAHQQSSSYYLQGQTPNNMQTNVNFGNFPGPHEQYLFGGSNNQQYGYGPNYGNGNGF